jgi:hypothetical protein
MSSCHCVPDALPPLLRPVRTAAFQCCSEVLSVGREQPQIGWIVVQSVAVDVVYDLTGLQVAA